MTEAELLETSVMYFGLSMDTLSFYMTVSSGYLIVAYLAGSKLTSSQMTVISTLYIFMSTVTTYGLFSFMTRATELSILHHDMAQRLTTYASPVVPVILSSTMGVGIVACLRFMWNVRHPNSK